MQPGEVWDIDYPATDGREQAGNRPALVLQDEGFARRSPLVLTVPLTTSAGTTRFPAVIPLPATTENGLTADSFLLVFQLRATDRNRVRGRRGQVTPAVLAQVYEALDRLTGRTRPPGAP
jgi:mRNA interferase MazF